LISLKRRLRRGKVLIGLRKLRKNLISYYRRFCTNFLIMIEERKHFSYKIGVMEGYSTIVHLATLVILNKSLIQKQFLG